MPRKIAMKKGIAQSLERVGYQFKLPSFESLETNLTQIARANPILASAIRAIIKNTTQPVLKVWDSTRMIDVDHPFLSLLAEPNYMMDQNAFIKYNFFQYLFDGNTYIKKIRDLKGNVIALLPLPYDRIEPVLRDGVIFYRDINGRDEYTRDDIIHIRDMDFGNSYLVGMSPLKHLIFPLITSYYSDVYNEGILQHGGQPAGFLKTDQNLTDAEAKAAQERWAKRNSEAGKTAVLGKGLEYIVTGTQMKDMGYQALKKVSTQEILAIYKVPPVEIGLTDGSNYANSQSQIKIFWSNTIKPLMETFAQALTKDLFVRELKARNLSFYYDFSNILPLQDDLSTKLDIASKAYTLGFSLSSIAEKLEIPFDVDDIIATPSDGGEKSIKKSLDAAKTAAYRTHMKDTFVKGHRSAEKKFTNDLEKFFIKVRNRILDVVNDVKSLKAVDLSLYNLVTETLLDPALSEELILIANKNLSNASDEVVSQYLDQLDIRYRRTKQTDEIINRHGRAIAKPWETVRKNIQEILVDAVAQDLTPGQLADLIKQNFDITRDRSITIARTEITSVSNDLIQNQFENDGYTEKEWLTAEDSNVRALHVAMDGQSVPINERFTNGLLYPGDPSGNDASQVVNCRCTLLPK